MLACIITAAQSPPRIYKLPISRHPPPPLTSMFENHPVLFEDIYYKVCIFFCIMKQQLFKPLEGEKYCTECAFKVFYQS